MSEHEHITRIVAEHMAPRILRSLADYFTRDPTGPVTEVLFREALASTIKLALEVGAADTPQKCLPKPCKN
jgi:hypothetical protein